MSRDKVLVQTLPPESLWTVPLQLFGHHYERIIQRIVPTALLAPCDWLAQSYNSNTLNSKVARLNMCALKSKGIGAKATPSELSS